MHAHPVDERSERRALGDYVRSPWMPAALVRVAIAGLLAIGLSGALASAMGARYGRAFVSGDRPGVTYSRSRCADYLEYEPTARSCEQAATWHHYGETVGYRSDAGILGLLVLFGYLIYRRRNRTQAAPATFTPLLASAAFGLATLVLLGPGLYLLITGHRVGVGDLVSAGIVSAIAALIAAAMFVRARFSERRLGTPS